LIEYMFIPLFKTWIQYTNVAIQPEKCLEKTKKKGLFSLLLKTTLFF